MSHKIYSKVLLCIVHVTSENTGNRTW